MGCEGDEYEGDDAIECTEGETWMEDCNSCKCIDGWSVRHSSRMRLEVVGIQKILVCIS